MSETERIINKIVADFEEAIGRLEIKSIFAEPKFATMEELELIRRNSGKKKAYLKSRKCGTDD